MADENDELASVLSMSWAADMLTFKWRQTEGAKCYILQVRDVAYKEILVIDKEFPENVCIHMRKMDQFLCYGVTCEMKVKTCGPDNNNRETEWRRYVIGGPTIPRHVKASVDMDKPHRRVKIHWDAPDVKPEYYEVMSLPVTGVRKMLKCSDTKVTFERLRSSTQYLFQIYSIYKDGEMYRRSDGGYSNSVTTHPNPNQVCSAQFSNLKESKLQLKNAPKQNQGIIKNNKPDTFDKPIHIEMEMFTEEDMEMATVSWESPKFTGENDDFTVIQYGLEIREGKYILFRKNYDEFTTKTEKFMVNLGKCYAVHIKTTYEEIDTEKKNISDCVENFYSRPQEPKISSQNGKAGISISWMSLGAEKYSLEITESFSGKLIERREGGKKFKMYLLEVNDDILFGRYYTLSVTASGKSDRHSTNSIQALVGGDTVPSMVEAKMSSTDPCTSVDIKWEKPHKKTSHYRVYAVGDPDKGVAVEDTHCTMKDLQTGREYSFCVVAVFDDGMESHGCLSNTVFTDAKQVPVSDLTVRVAEDHPDSEMMISWTEAAGAVEYKVTLTSPNYLQQKITMETTCVMKGLEPSMKYDVTVAAGNNNGFWKEAKCSCITELPAPTNLSLTNSPSDSVNVKFEKPHSVGQFHAILSKVEADKPHLVDEMTTDDNEMTFTGLKGSTSYVVEVKSSNRERRSRAISRDILTVPSACEISSIERSDDKPSTDFSVSWTDDNCQEHEIEIGTDDRIERIIRVGKCSNLKYRCLENGALYSVRVRSGNDSGYGDWCEKRSIQLTEN